MSFTPTELLGYIRWKLRSNGRLRDLREEMEK
jgi:hypothetical protein